MHLPQKPSKGQPIRAELIGEIIDCLRMFRPIAGPNIRVNTTPGGSIISGTPGGSAAVTLEVAPYTVRRHGNQWEIYIPDGCCNYGGTCEPINAAAATGGDDHASDASAWRVLSLDESAGTTGTDAAGNTYREWAVEIHVKPSAKMWQVDDLNKPARRLVWACAVDRLKPSADLTDAERYANTPGDSWSCVVARVRVTTVSGAEPVRKVTQLRDTPIDVSPADSGTSAFGLVWYFSVSSGALTVERVFCLRQTFSVAGISVTGNTMTDVTGADYVYARINTADMSDGHGLITVVSDPENPHVSTDLVTWLVLFRMTNNTVIEDYRENSIRNIQLYRA